MFPMLPIIIQKQIHIRNDTRIEMVVIGVGYLTVFG